MKRSGRAYIFILLSLAAIYSCATPGVPTGGPLDKTPPRAVSYQPENLSKNVEVKTITITFDEWVQISNTRQQVIISPPMTAFPEITAKKNNVYIRFKDNLLPNTTYSIYFGESIKDVRENNPANNIRYVFSTGAVIDSLSISGQLTLPAGERLPENTYAFLYTSLEDSAVVKEKPAYAFKFNKGNDFRFDYLPARAYRLIALADKNNNFLYDLPTEWIGAYHNNIILDTTITGIQLPIMLPEPETYKISEYSTTLQNGILQIRWNKAYNPENDPFSVKILNAGTIIKKPQYFTRYVSEYYVLSDSNSITCEVISQGRKTDTIRLKPDPKGPQQGMLRTSPQTVGKFANLSLYQNQAIWFQSSIPITDLQENKIVITDSAGMNVPFSLTRVDSLWSFTILPMIQPGVFYRMKLQDSAITFINQTFSKEQEFRLSLAPSTQFGKITFKVKLPSADTAYLVSIKASNGKILSEAFIDGDTQYVYTSPPLTAGGYLVEVLEDKNRSYTWNGGSFWKKTSPERVFRSETVNVKENWEQEIRVDADFSIPVLPLPAPEEKEPSASEDKTDTPNNKVIQDNRPMFDR